MGRHLMLELAGLAAVLVVIGCGGDKGDPGPQGPPGPLPDRSDIYCRTASPARFGGGQLYTLRAECDSVADVPWSGSCEAQGGIPDGYQLSDDRPENWDNPAAPAAWRCDWRAPAGVTPVEELPGTAAWMCCVAGQP